MKHVFLVNSHTTFLSSMGVINYLNILDNDVILLFARNYSNSIFKMPYTIIEVNDLYNDAIKAYCAGNKIESREVIKLVDKRVCNRLGNDYHLYVPNFNNALVCLLYSNKKCKRVSFIQEAAQPVKDAYDTDFGILRFLRSIVRTTIRGFSSRLWIYPCYYRKEFIMKQDRMFTYGLNEVIFSHLPAEHHIIKWPKVSLDICLDTNASFFVMDGWVKHSICESDIYLKNIKKIIEQNSANLNYIKFHPNESEEEKKNVISFFEQKKLEYKVIDQSIPFELILTSFGPLKIIGTGSALCFFAKDLGHKVVCHDDWLYNESKKFRDYYTSTGFKLFKEFYK